LLGVRTAFHSPGDISPVGVAANLAVDVSTPAFGYQESTPTTTHPRGFPGTPAVRDGHLYPSEQPGWGVDIDEVAAAKFRHEVLHERWSARVRRPDGVSKLPEPEVARMHDDRKIVEERIAKFLAERLRPPCTRSGSPWT